MNIENLTEEQLHKIIEDIKKNYKGVRSDIRNRSSHNIDTMEDHEILRLLLIDRKTMHTNLLAELFQSYVSRKFGVTF